MINGVSSSYSYSAGSNRLASASGVVNYSYNADGSATGDGAVVGGGSYTYDGLGRSATWTRTQSNNLMFAYNGLGQRVSKLIQTWKTCGPALAATAGPTSGTASSTAQAAPAAVCTPGWLSKQRTHYLYDDAGRFIGEYDTTTTRWQDTVWFNGQPVAVVQADGVYYVHADHLATPRSIVKASNGAEIWRWDSEPFGAASPTNPNPASGGLAYNVRFPGQYLDVESGVHYNGMRDYQPATGRYLQADPIGLGGGLARDGYVGGNPLSRVDPTGLLYVAIRVEFSGMFIVLHNVDGPGFNVPTYEGLFQIPNAPCNFLCFIKDKDWDKARQDSDPNRLAGLNPPPLRRVRDEK